MSRQNREQMQNVVRRLFLRQMIKLVIAVVLLPVILSGIYWAGVLVTSQFTWYQEDWLWQLLVAVKRRITLFAVLSFGAGFLGIVLFFMRKPFLYLRNVLEATEMIYREDENLIELPKELREAENQLNQVKMQMERNARAAKEAEQRKNDLIVYLAHDLKTPLTSVIGYLTLLRDEGQISEELREKYLGISLDKAEHLEDLINEFFEITRFNLSALTLEKSRVNLTRMLEQIIYEFKPLMDEKELVCTLGMPKDLQFQCDVGKMQRVFDNLFRNAVNYSFSGAEIAVSVEENEKDIEIVCTNHGNTIPEEKLGRIFEQFFRLDSARTSRSGGAGLGLAIAKEIVELHGGTIRAQSQDEEIQFIIRLPK